MNTALAAAQAGVSIPTVRNWCRIGAVAAVKQAGRWIIDTASLAARIAIGAMKRPAKPVVYSVETMTAIGGRRWTKAGHDRVYLNEFETVPGLELDHYKSGSISYATLDGEKVSNAEGGRLASSVDKVYFDAADGKVHIKWGWGNPRSLDRDEIAERIFGAIRAAIAAL
ncbi:helix-turn-helix domain-containing protein [Streptomyces sp. NPDC085946]|uniref:helix-turn-helix domain-containing protein n=1 Tax=Streptomyces sp. NPDC085946 TaxID=3365744 RepID=UPI0037D4A5F9